MPRKNVWREVGSISMYTFEHTTVDAMAKKFKEMAKDYPGARIVKCYYPYEEQPYFSVQQEQPESDKEMEAREAQEAEQAERLAARDRAEFDRLQKKYGGTQ
jgi:arabinogalactan endo-1,4-beta-galactosidase